MEKKFKALRTIAIIFKIISWIVLALTVIMFFVVLLGGSFIGALAGEEAGPMGALTGVFGSFFVLIYGFFLFIGLYAWAEIIMVLLAIEENTRKL